MKIRNLLIIFLVALLGSLVGTYSVIKITNTKVVNIGIPETATISSIDYKDFEFNELSDTISKAIKTVVEINCKGEETVASFFGGTQTYNVSSSGSGVIIAENGYIVTNNHVVDNANSIIVKTYTGDEYEAMIIGKDSRSDIAVIKIEANNLPFSSFANSDELKLGQTVVAIGNPLGLGIACSDGIISSLNKKIVINSVTLNVLQTNAAVNEGNSGGGLFDSMANIVGIVNAKTSDSTSSTTVEGMGYAIPSNNAKKIVLDLITYGYVKDRATIGVSVYTGSASAYYQDISGALVSEVVEGYAAYDAGIKAGDVIIGINDEVVTNYTDLARILDTYKVGDVITVRIYRNRKYLDFKLTLSEAIG